MSLFNIHLCIFANHVINFIFFLTFVKFHKNFNLELKRTYQNNVFHFDNFLIYLFFVTKKTFAQMWVLCETDDLMSEWSGIYMNFEHETIYSDLLFHTIHRTSHTVPCVHNCPYTQVHNQLFLLLLIHLLLYFAISLFFRAYVKAEREKAASDNIGLQYVLVENKKL